MKPDIQRLIWNNAKYASEMFWLMHVAIKMFYDEIRKLFTGRNVLLNLFVVRTDDDTRSGKNNSFRVFF